MSPGTLKAGAGRGHLILTGASGYIGRAVVEAALAEGRRVTVLGRRPVAGARFVAWRLGEGVPEGALDPDQPAGEQALVHLAHDWGAGALPSPSRGEGLGLGVSENDVEAKGAGGGGASRSLPETSRAHPLSQPLPPRGGEESDPNLAAALILRDSARALGIGRTIFISSLSARPDALNRYGRCKFAIEGLFDRPGEASLRVGLVYGGPRTAMYGLLCRIVGLTPVLPMIRPGQPVQPIHRDEVARGILAAADRGVCGPLGLAGAEPMPFGRFLRELARCTRGRGVMVLPLPLGPVLLACRVLNALPVGPTVDPERVLGLAGVRFVETRADLERLGLTAAPFAEGMAREPATRRLLLAEARCVLGYVLRGRAGGALARRYARAVGTGGAAPLPPLARRWPGLLRWVEPLGGKSELRRRLGMALALAEASPEGERTLARGGRLGRLAALAMDLALDGLAMPVRLVLGSLAR